MSRIDQRINRPYIDRLNHDPRLHQMVTGWTAQAISETMLQYDHRNSAEQIASTAAHHALKLAMAFILDCDGEYKMVCEERDQLMEKMIEMGNLAPGKTIFARPY